LTLKKRSQSSSLISPDGFGSKMPRLFKDVHRRHVSDQQVHAFLRTEVCRYTGHLGFIPLRLNVVNGLFDPPRRAIGHHDRRPSSAKSEALAKPVPAVEPVTRAFLFVSNKSFGVSLLGQNLS
jgi:hypothetical protein